MKVKKTKRKNNFSIFSIRKQRQPRLTIMLPEKKFQINRVPKFFSLLNKKC